MKTTLLILMCYLNQPVAIFFSDGEKANLYPYETAPVSAEAKVAGRELCEADEPSLPENFKVWHLDKLNHHVWAQK